jgi:uncharacterized protein (DUF2384 family)
MSPDVAPGFIDDLAVVLARAVLLWAPETAASWLFGSNGHLDGARPIDLLLTGAGAALVLDAFDAARGGAYP